MPSPEHLVVNPRASNGLAIVPGLLVDKALSELVLVVPCTPLLTHALDVVEHAVEVLGWGACYGGASDWESPWKSAARRFGHADGRREH